MATSFSNAGYLHKIRVRALFVFFTTTIFLSTTIVSAQYQVINIPELRQKIKEAKADTTRTRLYGILGWELRFTGHAESERIADEMIRMATPSGDHQRLAEAYKIKGFARIMEQKIPEALDMYALSITHAKKANDGHTLAHVTSLIAGMYQDKGDFDKMIRYYLESLQIAERYHDEEMTAFISNCIGEAYSDAGRPISFTLPFYQKAMKIEVGLENWQYVGMICSNIAKDYMLAGKKAEAEKSAAQAIDYINKKNDRLYVYATVATDIGEVYAGIGKYAEAEKYLLEGFTILDSLKTKDNLLIPLAALAKLYVKKNELPKAEAAANRLLQLAVAYRTKPFLRDGYKVLSDIARQRNQPALALEYYSEYTKWKDSVFNDNKEKTIANIEARVKLQQKELEVKYETQQRTRENTDLRQFILDLRYKTIGIVIVAVLLLVMGAGLIVLNRSQGKKNKELEKQKQIIEKQSIEKDTLIKEINHRVKNNLQVISSLLNLQANSLTDAGAIEALRDSHKRVKAISLIHQKLFGFEEIASIPLDEYIKALFADLKMMYAAKHVLLVCITEPEGLYLDIESAVPVGLILNELITNALKYAYRERESGTLFIDFTEKENSYLLSIRDNGVGLPEGFDPERSSSLGFRIIKELSRQLRGEFHFETDKGAIFTINFPDTVTRRNMG